MIEIERELTQLENKIFEKINIIEKYAIQTKYKPKRVEPGIAVEIELESNWSKFTGETLFINQNFLKNSLYEEVILWREAFLLFVPIELRNFWWVKILANVFPLTHRLSIKQHELWEKLIKSVNSEYIDLIDKCKLIGGTAGSIGLINALKKSLYLLLSKQEDKQRYKQKIQETSLTEQEFDIILSNIYFDLLKITENAVSILELALIKQTLKANEIAKFSNIHPSSINKIIKKLLAMNILQQQYSVNYYSLGLTQYVIILLCTKKQSQFFRSIHKSPYLFSQKFNCLNTCVITQYYIAPKISKFYNGLVNFCKKLKQENRIIDFYTFEIITSFRNYLLKYFNHKTKLQEMNFNDIVIESNIFNKNKEINNLPDQLEIGNIIVPTRITKIKPVNLDLIDIQIINQFLAGISNRRTIQKNIKRNMNEIVQHIKKLYNEKVIYENIITILPDSNCELTLYIENESNKLTLKDNYRSFKERLIQFCYHLSNIYFAEIKGSYNGFLLRSFLPHSFTLNMADFFNWYLPDNVNNQIILGDSIYQKYSDILCEDRWNEGNWFFSEKDFEI